MWDYYRFIVQHKNKQTLLPTEARNTHYWLFRRPIFLSSVFEIPCFILNNLFPVICCFQLFYCFEYQNNCCFWINLQFSWNITYPIYFMGFNLYSSIYYHCKHSDSIKKNCICQKKKKKLKEVNWFNHN
jgi:hypothetical protein